jgi:hypothetical protein
MAGVKKGGCFCFNLCIFFMPCGIWSQEQGRVLLKRLNIERRAAAKAS